MAGTGGSKYGARSGGEVRSEVSCLLPQTACALALGDRSPGASVFNHSREQKEDGMKKLGNWIMCRLFGHAWYSPPGSNYRYCTRFGCQTLEKGFLLGREIK